MTLSDKRFISKCGFDVIQTEDVKEFIKIIKENQCGCKPPHCPQCNCIDRHSGEKLI